MYFLKKNNYSLFRNYAINEILFYIHENTHLVHCKSGLVRVKIEVLHRLWSHQYGDQGGTRRPLITSTPDRRPPNTYRRDVSGTRRRAVNPLRAAPPSDNLLRTAPHPSVILPFQTTFYCPPSFPYCWQLLLFFFIFFIFFFI